MKKFYVAFFLPVLVLSMISCRQNKYSVDISGIDADIKIRRLEMDLFTPDPSTIPSIVPELRKNYGSFLQLFSYVINTGDIRDSSFSDFLVRFCTDRQNNEVYDSVMKVFPGVTGIESKLTDGFRHYRYYFPGKVIPSVYTCISGFNNSIIAGDSALGISLEKYLGAGSRFYPQLNIYKYVSDKMTPDNVVPDCMYGWAASEWDFRSMKYANDNVLAEMLHYGKLKYFERCMLPAESDELIFGFTAGQMNFCRNNEGEMWQYLVEKDLLFSTDQLIIRKLTGEAPFTGLFTREAPGKAAVWVGFRIIESYMQKNRKVSLGELMEKTNIQEILDNAHYHPQ